MNPNELEQIYESLARKVDEVGEENSELFLAKLVLLLANSNGDVAMVQKHIDDAGHNFY